MLGDHSTRPATCSYILSRQSIIYNMFWIQMTDVTLFSGVGVHMLLCVANNLWYSA